MNVNSATFDLLLGRSDWGRCLDNGGTAAHTLDMHWSASQTTSPVPLPNELPDWNGLRDELVLKPLAIELPTTPGETALDVGARRCAAADRHGNVYRIADDRHSVMVFSAGSRTESVFWPVEREDCNDSDAASFTPLVPASPSIETYFALTVTHDDYLVVAFECGARRGFASFDLLAGGSPAVTLWPAIAFHPFDMVARPGGGLWLLERDASASGVGRNYLWELDCKLAVVIGAQAETTLAAEQDDFQPTAGPPRARPAAMFPGSVDLQSLGIVDAIAVECRDAETVLVLERDALQRGRVWQLKRESSGFAVGASRWLTELPDAAHDFLLALARRFEETTPQPQLFIVTQGGNQARAYGLSELFETFALKADSELFPLRRFGGRALVSKCGEGHYDSGIANPAWTPIVQQPRSRFASFASFVTPAFDAGELGTVWDRVVIDACLPPDTELAIESRAGDDIDLSGTAKQVVGPWMREPDLHLRGNGAELPWLRREAARATRVAAGVGSWESLLQAARGRYIQLKLTLRSRNGTTTPRLRALRIWSPRFSYPKRFLPAVYREQPADASFLERWLANFESTFTCIEDRIATLQWLFDSRTVPAEHLAWLAEWFDLALDPEWDDRRRRIFVRHAMDFFQWRGTPYGLRLALELAFDACFDDGMFAGPAALPDRPQSIRLVEAYQTRSVSGIAVGTGLRDRIIQGLQQFPKLASLAGTLPLTQPTNDSAHPDIAQAWADYGQSVLGFVPSIGAEERGRWQNFLLTRYVSASQLATAHGAVYASFGDVPLPRDWPPESLPQLRDDWRAFCARPDGALMRARWQDFLTRRYRRIDRLDRAWGTSWESFADVALPDVLPPTDVAANDWLRFERDQLAMQRTAHRFSVLLPVSDVTTDPFVMETRLGLARRIVELEKPAHTTYDVRFYWALFRVGEARLEIDTLMGQGSRAPELIPSAVLGKAYIGASFVGGTVRPRDGDRLLIAC